MSTVMSETKTPNPYLKTKVMTASPAELRLMLFDGAIKFLDQGKTGLEEHDFESAYNGIHRCQNIVMELITSLKPDVDQSLCEKLSALYTFMYSHLVQALTERSAEKCNDVLKLLRYERDTWALLMRKLADENGTAGQASEDIVRDVPEPPFADRAGGKTDSIVGGSVSLRG